eukprot:4128013-Alexandrium_andersonii.AAC.1
MRMIAVHVVVLCTVVGLCLGMCQFALVVARVPQPAMEQNTPHIDPVLTRKLVLAVRPHLRQGINGASHWFVDQAGAVTAIQKAFGSRVRKA